MDRRKTIIICVLGFIAGIVMTLLAMTVFNVSIGDKIFISLRDYEKAKQYEDRFEKVNEMYDLLVDNYYIDLDEEALESGMIKGLYEGTGDPYTKYMDSEEYSDFRKYYSGKYDGIGVVMAVNKDGIIEVSSIMDNSPAQEAGIKEGDLILSVDGVSYEGKDISNAALAIKGEKGSTVSLVIKRDGETKEYSIQRDSLDKISVFSEIKSGNVGYIRIATFTKNTAEMFREALDEMEKAKVKGLVIDIRSNGGGLIDQSIAIADMLMNEGTIVYTQDVKGDKKFYKAENGRTSLDYVVLVNGGSASASEVLAIGIKGNKEGKVMGTQTYGKGITQRSWNLRDGDGAEITISQYYGPNNEKIHGKGVTPDIKVEIKDEDIEDGLVVFDRQLDEAIKYIKNLEK